jgi:transposase
MGLDQAERAELRTLINSKSVSAVVATRARIVLWTAEGRRRIDVSELAGVSLPTVDRWVDRYEEDGGRHRTVCGWTLRWTDGCDQKYVLTRTCWRLDE